MPAGAAGEAADVAAGAALAVALKQERPQRTAALVHQIMVVAGERPPTVRTLQTHFARAGLNVRVDGRTPHWERPGSTETGLRGIWGR